MIWLTVILPCVVAAALPFALRRLASGAGRVELVAGSVVLVAMAGTGWAAVNGVLQTAFRIGLSGRDPAPVIWMALAGLVLSLIVAASSAMIASEGVGPR